MKKILILVICRQCNTGGFSVILLAFPLNTEFQCGLLNNLAVLGTSTAIVYIAVDTRLGCLDANLAPDSEPQKMIDCVQVQFESLLKLEFEIPIWK